MAITERHGIYGVTLHTDAMGGAVLLPGITETPIDMNPVVQGDPTSGTTFPQFKSLITQKPVGRIATFDIRTALTNIGSLGLLIASTTNPGVVIYAQKREQGGTREVGSTHRSYTFGNGIVVPRSLSVSVGGSAIITYDIIGISSDGIVNPVVITESVALPSDAGLDTQIRFGLGPVKIEDTLLQGVENLELDFGVNVFTETDGPETFDTFVSIESTNPSLTISGRNILEVGGSGPVPLESVGFANATATTKFGLKRRLRGGTYYADTAVEHVVIGFSDGMTYPAQLIQNSPRLGTVIRVEGYSDDNSNPLSVTPQNLLSPF